MWTDIASNPIADASWCELLAKTPAYEDINMVQRPRNMKWKVINLAMRTISKLGISHAEIVESLAYDGGGTALSRAAQKGNVRLVLWLVHNGAIKTVHLKNKLGYSPLDISHAFGPHREVEGNLGSIMLDSSFLEKLAVSKGRQMLGESAGRGAQMYDTGTAESKHDDTNMSSVHAPGHAEPANVPFPVPKKAEAHDSRCNDYTASGTAVESKKEQDHILIVEFEEARRRRLQAIKSTVESSIAIADAAAASKSHAQSVLSQQGSITHDTNQAHFEILNAKISTMHETNLANQAANQERFELLDSKLDAFMASVTKRLGAIEQMGEQLNRMEQIMTTARVAPQGETSTK